ncbi:MAG TPA: flagellar basal-body MS-ring/collar protein FliF [Armatimonadota bacterium]|jgi:flagellar M-ring protein FliF
MHQLKETWAKLNPRQRTILIVFAALTVVASVVLVSWGQRADYRVLYTELSPQDAGAVTDFLQSKGCKYRLGQGGAAVEVDAGQVYSLRNSLAQAGLPRGAGGIGFELFDKSGLPGSEFSNQVSYQRALQGELERTISGLDKVHGARVHLVLAKNDLYGAEQQASASVMVDTGSREQLSSQEVDGIVNLVAGAVQGLKPQTVSLVDAQGRILNDASNAGGAKLSLSQMETRRDYERNLQQAIQGLLDRSLGENQAVVQVQADLDFDEQRIKSNSVLPTAGRGSVTEEKINQEKYSGGAGPRAGVAGVSANLTPGGTANAAGGSGAYTNRQESRLYEYTREERELVKAPGQVRRLTVAVALDTQAAPGAEKQIAEWLKAAGGLKDQRGDQIVIQRLDLAAKKQAEDAKKASDQQQAEERTHQLVAQGLRFGTPVLLALIIGGCLLLGAKQLRATPATPLEGEEAMVLATETPVGSLLDAADDAPTPEPAPTPEAAAAPESDLSELARQNPRLIAQQLRRWIGEPLEES